MKPVERPWRFIESWRTATPNLKKASYTPHACSSQWKRRHKQQLQTLQNVSTAAMSCGGQGWTFLRMYMMTRNEICGIREMFTDSRTRPQRVHDASGAVDSKTEGRARTAQTTPTRLIKSWAWNQLDRFVVSWHRLLSCPLWLQLERCKRYSCSRVLCNRKMEKFDTEVGLSFSSRKRTSRSCICLIILSVAVVLLVTISVIIVILYVKEKRCPLQLQVQSPRQ